MRPLLAALRSPPTPAAPCLTHLDHTHTHMHTILPTQAGGSYAVFAGHKSKCAHTTRPHQRPPCPTHHALLPTHAGGSYAVFAGHECARALAMMAIDAAECSGDLSGLAEKQLQTLEDWIRKMQAKYPVVGRVTA